MHKLGRQEQVTALKDLGNQALSENRYQEAVDFYTEALALDNTNHLLYSNRSAAHAKLKNYNLALLDGENAIQAKPDWHKGYSRKALAQIYLGRFSEAIQTYRQGLRIDPDNPSLQQGLNEAMANIAPAPFRNPFSGPEVMEKLRSDPRTKDFLDDPEYLKLLESLENDPQLMGDRLEDPKMVTTLSVLLDLPEPMESCESYNKQVPKSEPKPELPEEKQLAKQEKEKGNEAYKKKDFENAIQHYNKAIEHDPTDITFYSNLAAVFFEQKEFDKCIEQCEKGIEIGRENRADFKLIAKAFLRIANAYKKLKNWKQAKVYYEKSMSEHRTPEIKTLLSEIEKIIKEEDKKAYIDPAKSEEERELGNELFKKGDYAGAVKHYTEAIKRNPVDPKIYSNRAACYTKLAAFDLGLKDCDECVRLDPKFIKGWIRKGHILQGMQQSTKAIAAFQKALALDANNAEALQGYRACTLENAGVGSDPEKVRQRAMADPEVQAILRDPAMRIILDQMQNDPRALQDHLKNPDVAAKIQKLLESGLIAIH